MANEKRLIDANALMEEINMQRRASRDSFPRRHYVVNDVLNSIRNAPTVSAVEVVHGRCEYCKDGKSFIGARIFLGNDGKWHEINNCPNCGAKMDGGAGNG